MPEKPPKQASRKTTLLIISLLFISILGAIFLNLETINALFFPQANLEEKQELQKQIVKLEKEIEELTEESTSRQSNRTIIPGKTIGQSRDPDQQFDFDRVSCEKIDQRIQNFFKHLDNQGYIVAYDLQGGAQAHFKRLIEKLFANPPIVARETDSLFTILTNTAHFYRILGNRNALLIKEIMIREADQFESMLALFEQWSRTASECNSPRTKISLPIRDLYEYAGFFLNTLGGQAYLFRRNSHIRLLIRYYCVLVLDRANAEIVNRHGIDITHHLESISNEMEIFESMAYKEQYLITLRALKEKYQAYYEGIDAPNTDADEQL
jgi:hypothetical protein